MKRLPLLLAGIGALWLVTAAPASAHATVIGSDPSDGSRLASAPASVTISFDEDVSIGSGGYLHVIDATGKRVDTGKTADQGTKITVPLRSGLGDSTYTASYRVVSADTHPVTGAVRFVVGTGAFAPPGSTPSAVNGVTNTVVQAVRWVGFAGFAVLGGAWLLLTVWSQGRSDRRARRIVWAGWAATVAGTGLGLLLQGPYAAGLGVGSITDGSLLDATLHTSLGSTYSLRLVMLAVLAVLLAYALDDRDLAPVVALFGAGVAVSFGAIGHAATLAPTWLSIGIQSLHLAAMATWLGGLVLLVAVILPRRDHDELAAVLPVFSRVALVSVAVLATTGTYQAWRGIGMLDALTSTRYGVLVLVKVGLFVAILAVANVSRQVVQRRYRVVAYAMADTADAVVVAEPVRDETPRLRRSVLVEIVLAVGVLVATSVLVGEPPGKAAVAAEQARPKAGRADLGGGGSATVQVSTGRHGVVSVTVALAGTSAQSVRGTVALPSQQLGPFDLNLTSSGAGVYTANNVVLPVAGNWDFELTVQTSQFDAVVAHVPIHLA